MPFTFPGSVTVAPPQVPTLVMAPPVGGNVVTVLPVSGPKGDIGGTGLMAYSQTVTNPTMLVQLNHGLSFKPGGIVCLDTGSTVIEYASISYPMPGITELTFGFPFVGTVYVS